MLRLPSTIRVFFCTVPADMRRSFDGLSRMVEEHLVDEPTSGHLYVFHNKRCDRLKVLYWDGDGFAIWYKRLEQGTFRIPSLTEPEISRQELSLLLEGYDIKALRKRKRFSLKKD